MTTTTKGLLIASAALFPWSEIVALVAFGLGALVFAIAMPTTNDPSRCPSCGHDALLRIEASVPSPIPLLHCRACGDAYRRCGGTLYRDAGKPVF